MQPVRVPELIGVRFDGMGRAVGQAAAAPVLREQGFARVFGVAEVGEDVVAPPPVARRRDGVGYLNEDALLAMLSELHERTGAALAAGRFPVVYGADCSVLLATVPGLKGVGGHAGLLHLDGHEDATPMARTDSGEAANMEIRLLTGLDGERPAADMPVPLPALGPDAVAILGVRDAAFREQLDAPASRGSCSCGRPRRSAPRHWTAHARPSRGCRRSRPRGGSTSTSTCCRGRRSGRAARPARRSWRAA